MKAPHKQSHAAKGYLIAIKTLGYPSRNSLRKWYYEFRDNSVFKDKYSRNQKYAEEQK